MIEKVFAGLALAVCLVLMVRLMLGTRRRARFDSAARRTWGRIRHGGYAVWHWRSHRRAAQRAADDAIRRAREGEWEGNVYKPKSFRKPRNLH